MIDRQAPAQRSGVLASLNMVADTLKLLPAEGDGSASWSAAAWSTERTGWLFLTSTPETRQRLRPLSRLWVDTPLLPFMNQGQPPPRAPRVIPHEPAPLQRLPPPPTPPSQKPKSNKTPVPGLPS